MKTNELLSSAKHHLLTIKASSMILNLEMQETETLTLSSRLRSSEIQNNLIFSNSPKLLFIRDLRRLEHLRQMIYLHSIRRIFLKLPILDLSFLPVYIMPLAAVIRYLHQHRSLNKTCHVSVCRIICARTVLLIQEDDQLQLFAGEQEACLSNIGI